MISKRRTKGSKSHHAKYEMARDSAGIRARTQKAIARWGAGSLYVICVDVPEVWATKRRDPLSPPNGLELCRAALRAQLPFYDQLQDRQVRVPPSGEAASALVSG